VPLYELIVEDSFDAAHCLRGYEGSCERLHGHTYRVQVSLRAPAVDELGISLDFRKAKSALREVLAELDHQFLNDLPAFSQKNPSAEHIAKHVFELVSQALDAQVYRVTVWETPTAAASYVPD